MPSSAQVGTQKAKGGRDVQTPRPRATTLEGRELAQTMSYLGSGWLTRPERDAEENTTLLHEQLGLLAGQTACDVGAGNGYHTQRLAEAVGPEGRVIASDLQPEMLEQLVARMREAGITNVTPVQAKPGDPALPDGACDLILLVDVYHEFARPEPALASMRRALRPKGRIALAEYRAEDPSVPIRAPHKMSKAQIRKEYLPRGFVVAYEFDELPLLALLETRGDSNVSKHRKFVHQIREDHHAKIGRRV